jgi:hypothetical protein
MESTSSPIELASLPMELASLQSLKMMHCTVYLRQQIEEQAEHAMRTAAKR